MIPGEYRLKFPTIRRFTFFFFIFLILIYTGLIVYFEYDQNRKLVDYFDYRDELLDNSIQDILGTYEEFSNFIFDSQINQDSVLKLIAQANEGSETAKGTIRQQLYSDLLQIYERIQTYNFRQLHFHLANGESFLRFHSPDKYGDNLMDVRESIRIANEEKRYVTGFEEGRILNGYRFVYPLAYNGSHIGSVEVSVSMASVISELYKSSIKRDVGFLIDKDLVENTVFSDEQNRYMPSFAAENYLHDKEVFQLIEESTNSVKFYKDANFIEKLKATINEDLRLKESFRNSLFYNGKAYLVQYLAVKDISGKPAGYLFSISENSYLLEIQRQKMIMLFFSIFTILILITMFWITLKIQSIVRKMIMVDQLTQVYNRSSFFEFSLKEAARQRRNHSSLSFALLDIDHFKNINDTFGHSAGDSTLKQLAEIVSKSIREYDIFARYGGEEFVLLLPDTRLEDGSAILERIRERVAAYDFPTVKHITISAGVIEKRPEESVDVAISRADSAMYEAKARGRNQVVQES